MTATVVLVAHAADEHSDRLEQLVRARGAGCVRVSADLLPAADFDWAVGSTALRIGGVVIPNGAGALWRRPGSPDVSEYRSEFQQFAHSEATDAFVGALESMDLSWVTEPCSLTRAERKLFQLAIAARLGLPTPKTIVTNRSDVAVEFARATGEIVIKPVRYGLVATDPPLVSWTTIAREQDLEALDGPPVILQERIRASLHLRVVTVGSASFVSALTTDDLDWRVDEGNHQKFVPSFAFPKVEQAAVALSRALCVGLTSQDWVVDRTATAYFLEANPSGQWLFLDDIHGGQISQAVAKRLCELAYRQTRTRQ